MLSYSGNHWTNYQNQIKKYLDAVDSNPFYSELVNDFKTENVNKIVKNFNSEYNEWFTSLIQSKLVSDEWVDIINATFAEGNKMNLFCKYIENNIKINDVNKLYSIIEPENLQQLINKVISDSPEPSFKPTDLKFVTTTGIGYLETPINYLYLYSKFIPYNNIIKYNDGDEIIFKDEVVCKVIGCKTGNMPVKGYFTKVQCDFFNCATLNVALSNTKCVNVKLFE